MVGLIKMDLVGLEQRLIIPTKRFAIYMDKIITKCLMFLRVLVNQQKMKRTFIVKVIELGVTKIHI